MKKLIQIKYILLVAVMGINAQQSDFPKLTGPYLGQKPPGKTPEIFAPGIVSTEGLQLRLFFTPDGSEIVYMSMINIQDQGDKQVNMHLQFISMKMKNNIC